MTRNRSWSLRPEPNRYLSPIVDMSYFLSLIKFMLFVPMLMQMNFDVQVRIAAGSLRDVTEKSTSCRFSNLCE
jgi:hypothetical protein